MLFRSIADELSANDISGVVGSIAAEQTQKVREKKRQPDEVDLSQISLFDTVRDDDIIAEIRALDVSNLTPIEALNQLDQLQKKIQNRW